MKTAWTLQCSRCACCGKTGEDGVAITYGYKDEAAPNGERAMCCFRRVVIEDHLMETAPQTIFGRGTGSEQDEWSALATKIGMSITAIRRW